MPQTRTPPRGRISKQIIGTPKSSPLAGIKIGVVAADAAGVAAEIMAEGRVYRYVRALGMSPTDAVALHRTIKRGVPFSALRKFQDTFKLKRVEVQHLVQMPESTFARRRAQGRLGASESDRLLRMARIFDLAKTTFDGDLTEARGWLSRPQRVLSGATPEEMATTEIGAQEVERALLRIEHGVFA